MVSRLINEGFICRHEEKGGGQTDVEELGALDLLLSRLLERESVDIKFLRGDIGANTMVDPKPSSSVLVSFLHFVYYFTASIQCLASLLTAYVLLLSALSMHSI